MDDSFVDIDESQASSASLVSVGPSNASTTRHDAPDRQPYTFTNFQESNCPLFNLPREVRDRIYFFALKAHGSIMWPAPRRRRRTTTTTTTTKASQMSDSESQADPPALAPVQLLPSSPLPPNQPSFPTTQQLQLMQHLQHHQMLHHQLQQLAQPQQPQPPPQQHSHQSALLPASQCNNRVADAGDDEEDDDMDRPASFAIRLHRRDTSHFAHLPPSPLLTLTCRRICSEALPLLYNLNTFIFAHPSDSNMFRIVSSPLGAPGLHRLQLAIRDRDIPLWCTYIGSTKPERSLQYDYPCLRALDIAFQSSFWSPLLLIRGENDNLNEGWRRWSADQRLKELCLSLEGKMAPDVVRIMCTHALPAETVSDMARTYPEEFTEYSSGVVRMKQKAKVFTVEVQLELLPVRL